LLILFVSVLKNALAFTNVPIRSSTHSSFALSPKWRNRHIANVAVAEAPTSASFHQRMRDIVFTKTARTTEKTGNRVNKKPANLQTIETLEEYKNVIANQGDKIVVVRFFATWCKACKAIQPFFYRLAHRNPNIAFVDVPVTEKNIDLHQGLGVTSLPFGHIYHPQGGLVEELKMSKKHFPQFVEVFQSYVNDGCNIPEEEIVMTP